MPLSPSHLPHELLGLPWQFLVLGLALCLIFSALGFKRVEYFVSLGYAASVAAQAIAFPFLYRNTIKGLALLQSGLLLAYGLRLGIFLTLRERVPSFQKQQAENTARGIKVETRQCKASEVPSLVGDVDLVVSTTPIPKNLPKPSIVTLAFLTGVGKADVIEKIAKILQG